MSFLALILFLIVAVFVWLFKTEKKHSTHSLTGDRILQSLRTFLLIGLVFMLILGILDWFAHGFPANNIHYCDKSLHHVLLYCVLSVGMIFLSFKLTPLHFPYRLPCQIICLLLPFIFFGLAIYYFKRC